MTQGTVAVEAERGPAAQHGAHGGRAPACGGASRTVTSTMSAGATRPWDGVGVLVTDAAEAAEAIGRLGQDLAPRLRGPERPGDDLDETAARVFAALPVRRGVTVGRLTVVAGLPVATVTGVLGRLASPSASPSGRGRAGDRASKLRARRHGAPGAG